MARLVLAGDPLAPRLGTTERRRRLAAGVQQAVRRLESCSGDPSAGMETGLAALGDEARAFQSVLAQPRRRDLRDLVADGVDLVYRIERAVDRCASPPTTLDRALVLIARRHGLGDS